MGTIKTKEISKPKENMEKPGLANIAVYHITAIILIGTCPIML